MKKEMCDKIGTDKNGDDIVLDTEFNTKYNDCCTAIISEAGDGYGQILMGYKPYENEKNGMQIKGGIAEAKKGHKNFLKYIKKHGTTNLLDAMFDFLQCPKKREKEIEFESSKEWEKFLQKIAKGEQK